MTSKGCIDGINHPKISYLPLGNAKGHNIED